ncbi:MFS transporter [Paraburkholderia megapolitana]
MNTDTMPATPCQPTPHAADEAAWVIPGSTAYRRISVALFLAGFATFSLLYCVQPLLPVFAHEFGIGAAQSSLALSLSTGFLAFSILCASVLSERFGRRGMMFTSMAIAAVLNLAAALAPDWHSFLIARALEGLGLGGVPAIAMAYLAEEVHPRGLGFSMGLYVGGTAFGGMVGRVGMSIMLDHFPWRTTMWALGALDLAVAIAFVLLLPAPRKLLRSSAAQSVNHLALWRGHLSQTRLSAVFGIGCLVMGVFVAVYNYAGFRLMAPPFSLSATQTGLIFCSYVFGIVASSAAGACADRFGRGMILFAGLAVAIAGVTLTLSHALPLVVAGIVVLTIGFFITHSVASSWVGLLAQGAKGHASSLYLLAYYAGSSVLGSLGGWFWQNGGWTSVAMFSYVLLAMCVVLAMHTASITRRAPTRQKSA